MQTSHLAIVAALVLTLAALPAGGTPARPAPGAEPAAEELESVYDGTAIGIVLRANGNEVPRNGTELVRALAKIGDFGQLPVPFSAVALDSGLTHPRVVLAPRPGRIPGEQNDQGMMPSPGRGQVDCPPDGGPPRPTGPLNPAAATRPNLDGRLFFAANMGPGPDGKPRVNTIEFISWNSRKKKFDFGVIECSEKEPEIRLVDGVRCFACHKNRGPILGQGPWSNTTNNDNLRTAVLRAFDAEPALFNLSLRPSRGGWITAGRNPLITRARAGLTFDGISVAIPDPEVCDAAVRQGGELVRDREIYRLMSKTPDGRRGLVILLAAIAEPGPLRGDDDPRPLAANERALRRELDRAFTITDSPFLQGWAKIQRTSSSTLADYSPSGSMGTLKSVTTSEPVGWGGGSVQRTDTLLVWSGTPEKIEEYARRRAAGDHGMPSERRPSNPRAFVPPAPVSTPPRPSVAVNPVTLARALGLTDGDRAFMAKALAETARKINRVGVTPATLAREVFAGPAFADALADLPDREEFKDRFAAGLAEVANKDKRTGSVKFDRKEYASGPKITGSAEELQPAVVATTACLACHDVRGVGKPGFNPIPQLDFDPFDKQSREAWAGTGDPKKAEVLGRMLKRLVTDKDMPPEDSIEYELFRQKDPAAFDAVRQWLEAELKKAGGR